MDWSREEVEAIVADYLQMLTLELAGQTYSKTEHRHKLQLQLNHRSDGSIEFKHGNPLPARCCSLAGSTPRPTATRWA